VEEVGLLYERLGQQRISGLVIGYLLICDPPHQSLAQLQMALGVSAGSVSTVVRKLEAYGFLERAAVPGSRRRHYRIAEGSWRRTAAARLHEIGNMRRIAERGISLIPSGSRRRGARLQEMKAFYAFLEREMSALFRRWEG
jgi:DNA-binding transcriptional regulator GbsR (MarR family)